MLILKYLPVKHGVSGQVRSEKLREKRKVPGFRTSGSDTETLLAEKSLIMKYIGNCK